MTIISDTIICSVTLVSSVMLLGAPLMSVETINYDHNHVYGTGHKSLTLKQNKLECLPHIDIIHKQKKTTDNPVPFNQTRQ